MIAFNNGVTNIYNTPGIAADTIANQPAATAVAEGTIYIQTDGGKIQRSNGATWVDIGGGGGSTPGIDTVLAVNESLQNVRQIDLNTHVLQIVDTTEASIDVAYFGYQDIRLGETNSGQMFLDSNNIITKYASTTKGINLDFLNQIYSIGDENYRIDVDADSLTIQSYTDTIKFGFQLNKDTALFGDYNGDNYLKVDKINNRIYTILDTKDYGADLDWFNGYVIIGDFTGRQIKVDTANSNIEFDTDTIELKSFTLSSGVHAPSLQHLPITINGTVYYIQLLN